MLIALLAVLAVLKTFLERRRGSSSKCSNTQNETTPTKTTTTPNTATERLEIGEIPINYEMSNFSGQPLQQQQHQRSIVTASSGGGGGAGVLIDTNTNVNGGNSPSTSVIIFKTNDKQCCHEITDKNVKVIGSAGNHDHGSSKVKLKNIVDYKWEMKNYPGHLIAVHIDGKHIAYVINVNNKVSRMEGMVRVVNASSGLRALIKGMSGEVLDLQFAHIEKERILASIDFNSLYVHKIDMLDGTLLCNLIVKIEDPLTNYIPKYDKISWCPYIDVPGEDDEDSQLIVWARGSMFQCFNINVIVAEHGICKIHPDAIKSGYLKFHDELLTISWVALSPDGSTLGVGSIDGVIRFYQVYMHDKEPRCLHQWKPHNGKPISSFFFLDNLTKNVSDTYWKYAITAAANNTEFKVWDCGTWECLQTLQITTANEEKKPPHFIAEIDRTSSYMVLTSLDTRTCYILQIVNNNISCVSAAKDSDSSESNLKDTSGSSIGSIASNASGMMKVKRIHHSASSIPLVYIKSISEFPLSSGILSFSIVDAAVRRYKCANDNYLCEEFDDYDEETNSIYCVVVRMFIVQSKSMQNCNILYQPTVAENSDVKSTISNDSSPAAVASKDASLLDILADGVNNKNNKDDDIDVDAINIIDNIKQQEIEKSEQNVLEALLGINSGVNNQITVQTTTTTTSSVVSVAAAAAAAVPALVAELKEARSRTVSPQVAAVSTSSGGKGFTQVNLMTPDAFSSTINDKKTPDCVSSDVLNTILMLASVTGQSGQTSAGKSDNINLLNLVNNKIIEDQEHQKMQLKQTLESQKKFIAIDSNPGRNVGDNLASGGSSPSREVQEIMSLQEYDKSSYSGDELLDDPKTVTDSTIPDALDVSVTVIDTTLATEPPQSSSSSTNWTKLPKVQIKHSAELQNAANLISQAVVNASTASGNMNNSHVAPQLVSNSSGGSSSSNNLTNTAGNTDLNEINMKMSQLIDLVKVQSKQISSLQNEIVDMKKTNPMSSPKSMSEFSFKLEMQLSKLMEQYLKRYENEHKKKLAAFLNGRDVQNRELRDSIIQIINQYVLTQFGEVVSKVITIEIQRQLAPMLAAKIDTLQQQIQMDVAQKLTAFDLMLKENIAQVCKSKNIIDAFGKSVLVGVQGSLQAAFIESMSSTLIPAYEKSSQNMFKQLHEAFSIGIKEFMEQFDNYLQHLQPMQDSTEEILNKFSGFRQHLDSILVKHRNTVTETMLETRKDVKSLEILLSRQIQESMRSEVRKCLETQAIALRSQTNTPAPMYDQKDTIKLLLHQGQINKAFHQALLANDLNLVEFTLKSADHTAVFTPDCCLEQKVLLSLIQQISADMSNHNEVKQNYLAEALLAINPVDPITREHAPKVLQELFRNCQMFLINYPKSPQCSNVRMLLKAVQAYKDQF